MVSGKESQRHKFLRFQLTALFATCIDFSMTVFLKEALSIYYYWAVAGGAVAGACTAFIINRYWVFKSLERHPVGQGFRYLLVASGSIFLNSSGTYLLTESTNTPYLVSKGIVALIIGFTYSYYFSKRFVFYA
jgi:putative flippase GtrA